MDTESVVKAIVDGMRTYFYMIALGKGMSLYKGDVEWVLSGPGGGPDVVYDVSFGSEMVAARRVDELIPGIRARTVPWWWVLTPLSTPANIAQILASKGFVQMDPDRPEPGMALLMHDAPAWPGTPPGVTIRQVRSREDFRAWTHVTNTALHQCEMFHPDTFSSWLTLPYVAMYLAQVDGAPVATSMLIQDGSTATVEFISTMPGYRHRGIGAAMTASALRGMQERGVELATLRSAHRAIRMYQALGFRSYFDTVTMTYRAK